MARAMERWRAEERWQALENEGGILLPLLAGKNGGEHKARIMKSSTGVRKGATTDRSASTILGSSHGALRPTPVCSSPM